MRCTTLAEGIETLATKPVLHGDNGPTLKAATALAMLNWLGVKPTYLRPRVSDENADAESLFRTAKYRPEFPVKGRETLEDACTWAGGFVHWYSAEQRQRASAMSAPPSSRRPPQHDPGRSPCPVLPLP